MTHPIDISKPAASIAAKHAEKLTRIKEHDALKRWESGGITVEERAERRKTLAAAAYLRALRTISLEVAATGDVEWATNLLNSETDRTLAEIGGRRSGNVVSIKSGERDGRD